MSERRTSWPTDEMVDAAHARIHENVHEDFHFPTPICVREALEAALAVAEIVSVEASGPKVWACRDDQGWFVVHRSECVDSECAGPHRLLTLGRPPFSTEQPIGSADG